MIATITIKAKARQQPTVFDSAQKSQKRKNDVVFIAIDVSSSKYYCTAGNHRDPQGGLCKNISLLWQEIREVLLTKAPSNN